MQKKCPGRALPTLRGTLVVRFKPDEFEQFRNRLNGWELWVKVVFAKQVWRFLAMEP